MTVYYLGRYDEYNPTTKTLNPGKTEKSAYVVTETQSDFDAGQPLADYTELTGIEDWDSFGAHAGLDYIEVSQQVEAAIISKTYVLCSDNEKKAGLRRFVAGSANNYQDVLYTESQYDDLILIHIANMQYCMDSRNNLMLAYTIKMASLGNITRLVCQSICREVQIERLALTSDGLMGKSDGDELESFSDWEDNTESYVKKAITGINQGSKIITIAGTGHINNNTNGLEITGSTGNNKEFTIVSVAENGGNTEYTVSEVIDDATVDGDLYHNGLRSHQGIDATIVSDYKDIRTGKKKK